MLDVWSKYAPIMLLVAPKMFQDERMEKSPIPSGNHSVCKYILYGTFCLWFEWFPFILPDDKLLSDYVNSIQRSPRIHLSRFIYRFLLISQYLPFDRSLQLINRE